MAFGNSYSLTASTSFPVLDACQTVVDGHARPATTRAQALDMTASGKAWRQKYLYRRDELTNNPYANRDKYPESTNNTGGTYSRDVDGTFDGEWGALGKYYYPNSSFAAEYSYWTAEVANTNTYQYYAYYDGYIGINMVNTKNAAICRGE